MPHLYDRLLVETEPARADFLSIPIIKRAIAGEIPRELYLDFLGQAYHHVRHTCPLLALAAARTDDAVYSSALFRYIGEEVGHESWILSDMAALSDGAQSPPPPRQPCRSMIAYAYYSIERISPYALLGMVHVLEGISAALALNVAAALRRTINPAGGGGFLYLSSHGALDLEHTVFFTELVNRLDNPVAGEAIIDCANMVYWLYGNVFRDIGQSMSETRP
ncbi:MAG: TenA family transcriptional regulator [Rhodospirillales bacterium]